MNAAWASQPPPRIVEHAASCRKRWKNSTPESLVNPDRESWRPGGAALIHDIPSQTPDSTEAKNAIHTHDLSRACDCRCGRRTTRQARFDAGRSRIRARLRLIEDPYDRPIAESQDGLWSSNLARWIA